MINERITEKQRNFLIGNPLHAKKIWSRVFTGRQSYLPDEHYYSGTQDDIDFMYQCMLYLD